MIDDKKSTDLGLSTAERKELRAREAQEAISDHEEAQKALQENRERLPQRTPGSRGGRGPDGRSHSRAAGRYAYQTRTIFLQDPERSPSSRPKNRRRGAQEFGQYASQPSGFRKKAPSPSFARRWVCHRPMG